MEVEKQALRLSARWLGAYSRMKKMLSTISNKDVSPK
jgi:hypothetical protein